MSRTATEQHPHRVEQIAVRKLHQSDANVRRTDKRIDVEPLADDIAAHGVLQNLNVVNCGNGKFAVAAGILAAVVDLDMRTWWEPEVACWNQVPKSVMLSALATSPKLLASGEAERAAMLVAFGKMKKADLALAAAEALAGSCWLPEILITPVQAGAFVITESGSDAVQDEIAA